MPYPGHLGGSYPSAEMKLVYSTAPANGNLQAFDLPKETVTSLMMIYKNTKAMVCSPDSNTDFFNTVTGGLKGDTQVLYMFIIYLDYVL